MHISLNEPRLAADRLKEIESLEQFRAGFRVRLIGLFRAAVNEHLAYCVGDDQPQIEQRRHAAHALKGAALGIGASRVAALAYAVERAAILDAPDWPDSEQIREETVIVLHLLDDWAAGADVSAAIDG